MAEVLQAHVSDQPTSITKGKSRLTIHEKMTAAIVIFKRVINKLYLHHHAAKQVMDTVAVLCGKLILGQTPQSCILSSKAALPSFSARP